VCAKDISHLEASVTALCEPSEEARTRTVERCRAHGDDPDTGVSPLRDGLAVFCERPPAATLPDQRELEGETVFRADRREGASPLGSRL
jgi:hypothetical protein